MPQVGGPGGVSPVGALVLPCGDERGARERAREQARGAGTGAGRGVAAANRGQGGSFTGGLLTRK